MKLSGVNIAGEQGLRTITIRDEKITDVSNIDKITATGKECILSFDNVIAFPGLINSHDHLDFNLFPRLGNRTYRNYKEWGADLHITDKKTVEQVLSIPRRLRVLWGMYKNLLNGVTTVVNHGPRLEVDDFISVQQGSSVHSLSGDRLWWLKLALSARKSFIIHIGEGTDTSCSTEIDKLIKGNVFNKKLIGVHGIAMNEKQASHFHSLIWCPDSNIFLYKKTAEIGRLKSKTNILFGTDSTLSSSWNIWEQLRLAKDQNALSDAELFDALTSKAAAVWQLHDRGYIAEGQRADLVIARTGNSAMDWDRFYSLNPSDILLVMHKGRVRMFDDSLYDQLAGCGYPLDNFSKIKLMGANKHIYGDLRRLVDEIGKYYPSAISSQIVS